MKQSLNEGQNPTLRGVCEGRENRVSVTLGEAPGSVRGLTRVQYPSSVTKQVCGGWLEALTGTGKTVEVKQTLQEEQKLRPHEGHGREAKTEHRIPSGSCVKVREIPTGSNKH